LKYLAKEVVFLVLSGKKQISLLLASPWKNFKKSPSGPPWKKSYRRPYSGFAFFQNRIISSDENSRTRYSQNKFY